MKNWIIELEKVVGIESARAVVNALSGCLTVMTIVVGNWHLLL